MVVVDVVLREQFVLCFLSMVEYENSTNWIYLIWIRDLFDLFDLFESNQVYSIYLIYLNRIESIYLNQIYVNRGLFDLFDLFESNRVDLFESNICDFRPYSHICDLCKYMWIYAIYSIFSNRIYANRIYLIKIYFSIFTYIRIYSNIESMRIYSIGICLIKFA